MDRRVALLVLATELALAACGGGSSQPGTSGAAGTTGGAGSGGASGSAGANAAGTSGTGAAGTSGAGGGGTSGSGAAGATGGAAGQAGATGAGTGGADAGNDAGGGAAGTTDAAPFSDAAFDAAALPSFLPAGYMGTPFTQNRIPGRINACDYDRGGAGVAYCHSTGNCTAGINTGDYPQGAPVYRPPIPATARLCSGAACDDNVGVCRMNPAKPDKINKTDLAPADDTYLCYTQAGTWTKYTVVVEQAGTYAVNGFMAVPQGGAMNVSFGGTITTGDVTLPVSSPVDVCGGGEYYHCWIPHPNLSTITFPSAGTYLMTLTQTGRFNADNFTFTKM
jgi:hypothetical protein